MVEESGVKNLAIALIAESVDELMVISIRKVSSRSVTRGSLTTAVLR